MLCITPLQPPLLAPRHPTSCRARRTRVLVTIPPPSQSRRQTPPPSPPPGARQAGLHSLPALLQQGIHRAPSSIPFPCAKKRSTPPSHFVVLVCTLCNTPTTPGLAVVTPGRPLGHRLAPQTNPNLFYTLLSSLMCTREDFPIGHPP
jgi:hypothetical protein